MARTESTPLQTPDQIGDVYEQLRRLQQSLGSLTKVVQKTSELPTNPVVGDVYYVRETSSLLAYDGFAWRLPWNMPWGRQADTKITSPINGLGTGTSAFTALTVSFVGTAGRRYRIDAVVPIGKHQNSAWTTVSVSVNGGQIGSVAISPQDNESQTAVISGLEFVAAASGTITVQMSGQCLAGTYDIQVSPAVPAWLHVDDIGPAVIQAAPLPQGQAPGPTSGQLAVVVTTPTPASTLTSGASITVGAGAQPDPGQTITQVQFFVDGQSIGADSSPPYLATWATPTPGTHALTATATQSDGKTINAPSVSVLVGTGTGTGGGGTGGGGTGGGGTGGGTGGTGLATKLVVSGKVLKDPTGTTVSLRGVNQYVVPAWTDSTGSMGALTGWMDTNFGRVCDDLLTKGVNCVRIPIMYDANVAYTQRVVAAVNVLKQRGMYAILTPADEQTFGTWPSSTPSGTGGGTSATVPTFGKSLTHASFNSSTFAGGATNYTFTTDQPTAGRTVLAYITNIQAGASAVTPTLSGLGLTWTQRATVTRTSGGNTIRATLFTGTGSPSGTAFQVLHTVAQLGCGIQLAEFSNVDATTPVIAQPSNGNGATVTLQSATAPSSGFVWMGVSRLLQERQTNVGAFVGIDADWLGAPPAADATAYNAGNSPTGTVSYPTAADWVGIFAEIKPSAGASTTGSQNDTATAAAQFVQMMWNASGKPDNLMLEVWDEPVGTTLTSAQWQSGVQAAIAVLRSGSAAYNGPIFITGRNWGWAFDSAEATAIKNADPNVVFSAHRFAVQAPTSPPVGQADVTSFQSVFLNAASTAGVAAFVGSWGIYNGGWGTGGSKTANTNGWAAPMAAAIQSAVQGGTCVGEAAWMWLWGGQVVGDDDENSMEDPLWTQVVAGTAWTPNVWGNVVFQLTSALAPAGGGGGAPPPPPPPTVTADNWEFQVNGTGFIDKTGSPLVLRGVAQYLIEYSSGGSGASGLYTWFSTNIAAVATDWQQKGVNFCRIPITYSTAPAYINDLKAKVDALWAKGIRSSICAFDGSWGAYNSNTAPDQMAQVWGLIGSPRYCAIETNNEPNGITAAQWQGGMQNWVTRLRAAGYKGPVFCGSFGWSWTFDLAASQAIRNGDTNTGGHAGNVCIVNHRYAVSDPAQPVQPANDGTVNWKPQWPDLAGPGNVAFIMNEWGPWNGGLPGDTSAQSCTRFGQGGSYASNVDGWGENMRQEIQNAVTAGHMAGATGWMWAWSDPNSMTGVDAPCAYPTYVQGTAGPPWTLNRWGSKMFSMVQALAGTPAGAGPPGPNIGGPATSTAGNVVTFTSSVLAGGSTVTIAKVDFLVDGVVVATDTTSPYSGTWTSTIGTHTVTARATQSDGQVGTSGNWTITVASPGGGGGGGGIAPLDSWQFEVNGTSFKDVAGNQIVLRGIAQYLVTGSGDDGLTNWFTSHIAAVAADWKAHGVNFCRIPIPNNTSTAAINELKAKVDALWAQGIYSCICAFFGFTGLSSTTPDADTMFTIWQGMGSPRYCAIETNNEPNGMDGPTWQGGIDRWRTRLRTLGYKGPIFCGARDWSWTYDSAQSKAIKTNDTNPGGHPGNTCIVCHRYAVTDPANPVEPANDATVNWKVQWPDVAGPDGVAFIIDEWGPWNGGSISPGAYGTGGSYSFNVNSWGANMKTEIVNAVTAGHMAGAAGWMWAWSDPNTMTDANPESGSTAYVQGTSGPPWTLNAWGTLNFAMVSSLAAGSGVAGSPTVTLTGAPTSATPGSSVTVTATATPGGTGVTITSLALLIDGASVASDTTSPYSLVWTSATAGTHTIQVQATQSDGKTGLSSSSSISVTSTPPSGGAGLLHVSGKSIKDGNNNTVFLRGLNQYIVTPYWDSGSTYTGQYLTNWFLSNMPRIAAAWYTDGVRHIRMPVNCADNSTGYKDTVKQVVGQLISAGLYVSLNGFGGLGNYPSNAGNIGTYLVNLWNYCGSPAMCMINQWNEPHDGGWLGGSQAARSAIRNGGYTGIIFMDAEGYATAYDPASFSTLLSNDSAFGGNIAFSTHRYHALCSNSSYPAGYLPDNWCSQNWPGSFLSGAYCVVVGEYGFHNCYNQRDQGGGGTNWINFLNDATNTIIAGKNNGNCAGAWAWMWTWDENSLVDPSNYNLTQGAAWTYNTWGQIAKRMWANTAQGV